MLSPYEAKQALPYGPGRAKIQQGLRVLLCTEDDNSCYRNVCKMSVVSFALAVVFIIRLRVYCGGYGSARVIKM